MYFSMKNNTVNTEEKQESIRYVRYIFLNHKIVCPIWLEKWKTVLEDVVSYGLWKK